MRVAWIGSHINHVCCWRGKIDDERIARVAAERVRCCVRDSGAARVERQQISSRKRRHAAQIERVARSAAADRKTAQADRAAVASQCEVGDVHAGDALVETDRDRPCIRVARVGSHIDDVRCRCRRIDDPRIARVRCERVRRGVRDPGTARREREQVRPRRAGDAAQVTERPSHVVAGRQCLRGGQQVAAAVTSQHEIADREAEHRFAEADRDRAHRVVARIGSHVDDVGGERRRVHRPRLDRVARERVVRLIDNARTARRQRQHIRPLRPGDRREVRQREGDVV